MSSHVVHSVVIAFRTLLSTFMARRTKPDVAEQLNLPPCTFEDREVQLTQSERTFYERIRGEWRHLMEKLQQYLDDLKIKDPKDRRPVEDRYV